MQTTILKLKLHFIGILLATLSCTSAVFAQDDHHARHHKPITQNLITLLENDPALKSMLESSLAEAKKSNPDVKTNPAQNLSDYYD